MKRINKLCVGFITVFALLSIFLITSFAYSNQYPAYLGNYGETSYIEIQSSNFGRCALVFPINYNENYLSYTANSFVNVTSGTIYGYLVTQNGTTYDLRGQRLSTLQYATSSGYQTVYYDLTFTQIYNTNIRFTNNDTDNEFVKLSAYQIIVITILFVLALSELCNFIFSFVKNRYYYG